MLLEYKDLVKNIKKRCKDSFLPIALLFLFAFVLLRNEENFLSVAVSVASYVGVALGIIYIVLYFKTNKDNRLFSKNLSNGILMISLGIVAYFENQLFCEFITVILGGYILFQNSSRINDAFLIKDYCKGYIYILVMSLVNILLGIVIIINPFAIEDVNLYIASMIMISQVFLVIENIIILIGVKNEKKTKEDN